MVVLKTKLGLRPRPAVAESKETPPARASRAAETRAGLTRSILELGEQTSRSDSSRRRGQAPASPPELAPVSKDLSGKRRQPLAWRRQLYAQALAA